MYCMRFAIPPRELRLGGWRRGARSAMFLLFGVIGGLCGVLRDPLVCLGVPGKLYRSLTDCIFMQFY